MNKKALQILEYDKIISSLTEAATSVPGKRLCRELVPFTDIGQIRQEQRDTAEALRRVYKKGSVSFAGAKDIRESLKRLEVGASLSITELLNICSLLETASRAKAYAKHDTEEEETDSLDELFALLEPQTPLAKEIRRCIISEEEVSDDASSTLRHIRRSIKNANDKIHAQLNSMVNGSARNYLQENVITIRGDRYCLPVKAEYKGQVPGMIHDQSATGATLFIEPMAVVKLNNDLKELFLKEQEEIEVILANLSNLAAESLEYLKVNQEILTKLDFIFAKAVYAKQIDGSEPIFNTDGYINIKKGRHPLLDRKKVVPIDVRLGKEFDLLIVTGPNTGGKTVSLKTTGLLTLMGQAGLHIPAFDKSELSVFDEIYVDIGDEQSIEQNLSTFSSHMTNIVSILEHADEKSMVLFDELGAGTDPTEGAALAISILSYLHERGIRTMATTHYSELKVFALSQKGVENACCEFDVETLRPTYRLLIGIPGKSNAFAISGKLGLPDFIIDEARSHISEQDENFEDVLADLETSRKTIEKEEAEIQAYRAETERLKQKLEEKQEKLDQRREVILREANEEAHKILREAKDYADKTIREFRKYGSVTEMERERNQLRDQMNKVEGKLAYKQQHKNKNRKKNKAADFKVGDPVRVLSLNLRGTVSTLPNQKGDLYVQMGILRSQVNISDLELLDEPDITGPGMEKTSSGKIKMAKSATVGTEINLIGMMVDEAVSELDKYLDDAYLAHIPQVRIVHGKGTGALRKAVHNYLRKAKHVKSYRLGEFGEGDAGVTIAEFK